MPCLLSTAGVIRIIIFCFTTFIHLEDEEVFGYPGYFSIFIVCGVPGALDLYFAKNMPKGSSSSGMV